MKFIVTIRTPMQCHHNAVAICYQLNHGVKTEHEVVEAQNYRINSGVLVFDDDDDCVRKAYAPGKWDSVEPKPWVPRAPNTPEPCEYCRGSGRDTDGPCAACDGEGAKK